MSPWLRGQSGNPGGQPRVAKLFREMESLVTPMTFDLPQLSEAEYESPILPVGIVAAYLGITPQRLHQLDAELQPTRCDCGSRRYTPRTVVAYAQKRGEDREALALARSERMRELRKRL